MTSSENVTSRFCNNFAIIQSHYACKMSSDYPGIKLKPALGTWEDKIEHLSSYALVLHTTVKQVISRRRRNENVCEMSKNENCKCKACETAVFHRHICRFVTFLLPSSSWLLKLPNDWTRTLRNVQSEKRTCQARETAVFHFVTFSLSLTSFLLKLSICRVWTSPQTVKWPIFCRYERKLL